ncbi:PPE domain-containing protein [Mycobacterium avium]|uniref:PPE domain-containing protein n=1 Tax=Mycobacterium avium TaxID=1764 RepID=UPI00293C0569|nr:PPE domain-containing protein [Mycobacterium avium]
MDFATLPPEVSTGLMHSGPGAGSLIRAAAAWDGLARQLRAVATSYRAATAPWATRPPATSTGWTATPRAASRPPRGSPRPPTRTGRPARRWCPRR